MIELLKAVFCPTRAVDTVSITDRNSHELPGLRKMVSSGMLRRLALVRTEVSEEPNAFFIRVTRIGELGTTLAATSNLAASVAAT
jgi:hypothetical protein